jgi:hypothetical protein
MKAVLDRIRQALGKEKIASTASMTAADIMGTRKHEKSKCKEKYHAN